MRILLALLLCFVALDTSAASFPCAKAKSKVEKLICADPLLSKLDEDLASVYKKANTDWGATANDQHEWLWGTRNHCAHTECLRRAYRERIEALQHWHDPRPWTTPMLGKYLAYRRIYLSTPEVKSEPIDMDDCLSIAPADDGSMRLRLQTNQVNGHSCTLDAKVRKEGDGWRVIQEADDTCALKVRAESGLIVVDDPQYSCQNHCGARAHLNGLAYGRATHAAGRCEFEQ